MASRSYDPPIQAELFGQPVRWSTMPPFIRAEVGPFEDGWRFHGNGLSPQEALTNLEEIVRRHESARGN